VIFVTLRAGRLLFVIPLLKMIPSSVVETFFFTANLSPTSLLQQMCTQEKMPSTMAATIVTTETLSRAGFWS